ncbi:hypothetical protein LSH36_171g00000 [Paralvinella palmiformis]|uniref:Amino acid permease n=1 Tax=Paralvinella palmiformis TaxID=53620 RepID=A0AAD9JSY8_9ANNE|nr:hypothetical protein LSH36_171g00000 [Paralvinella palmiformis]
MANTDVIRMSRDINLLSACSIMTGVIIGSGIFISPVSLINNCGSVAMSLLMWVFSGFLSLCIALCFTELAGMFPRSGGEYAFYRKILGPLPAFVDVWHQLFMIQPSFQALLAITTTDYFLQSIFPDHCSHPPIAYRLITIWIIITVLYTLTNVAYFTVMSPKEMMSSKAVALTFAERTIGKFSKLVPFFVACSTIGSLNGAILGGSRYYYAAARDNLFPHLMSTIHMKYRTPWVSLFSVTAICLLYIVTGEAISLLEYLGFLATIMLLVTIYCVLYLKWKKPNMKRPIKV